MAPWVASHLPWRPDSCYVEPFFGAGSVLFFRQPVKTEIVNDQNDDLINFHIQVRDRGAELARLIDGLPKSRSIFEGSIAALRDGETLPLYRALAFYVVVQFGMMARSVGIGSGNGASGFGLTFTNGSGPWSGERVRSLQERLRKVQIERVDACDLLERTSRRPQCVVYVDPPYPGTDCSPYPHGVDYGRLTALLLAQRGQVCVSGIPETGIIWAGAAKTS